MYNTCREVGNWNKILMIAHGQIGARFIQRGFLSFFIYLLKQLREWHLLVSDNRLKQKLPNTPRVARCPALVRHYGGVRPNIYVSGLSGFC